jgi:hypothetical protein
MTFLDFTPEELKIRNEEFKIIDYPPLTIDY